MGRRKTMENRLAAGACAFILFALAEILIGGIWIFTGQEYLSWGEYLLSMFVCFAGWAVHLIYIVNRPDREDAELEEMQVQSQNRT